MTLQARVVLNLIAGAIGGVLAWLVIDFTGWFTAVIGPNIEISTFDRNWWLQLFLGGVLGCLVGLLLGIVDAMAVDSNQQRARGLALHGVVGFIGGMVGMWLGFAVWSVLAPKMVNPNSPDPVQFTQLLIARSFGWAFIGAGVGAAQGVARRSVPLIKQGLFGGLAGGFVGGVLFESAAKVVGSPPLARMLGFVSIGASTGFFIGLIQTLFKQAWVRVVLGRNEGKEYLIDKPVTVIGRSELADIGLFGNPKILPHHCAIEQSEGRFRLKVIQPETSGRKNVNPADVVVNGLVVNPDTWLTNGDAIVIDDRKLLFQERLTQRSEQRPIDLPPPPPAKTIAAVKIVEGADLGRTYPLVAPVSQIGRTDECAVCLNKDTLISRRHASINHSGTDWSITDSGSANGTYVNSRKLASSATAPLRPGDHIKLGDTVLKIDF
jgi:pSer/pThr/pTyr-binding forkhead associated (FHA) protein/uncharacterized membrane protein